MIIVVVIIMIIISIMIEIIIITIRESTKKNWEVFFWDSWHTYILLPYPGIEMGSNYHHN